MQTLKLATHELLTSVEDMLSPKTLSALLERRVDHVMRAPLVERMGTSLNGFEWVTAVSHGGDKRRYALKRIQFENDWFMMTTNDVMCRSVTLWQYGFLDRLSTHLDHTIVACSRDGDGWAILMNDVSAGQFPAVSRFASPHQIFDFLDALAFMHATFWEDDGLACACLGLCDSAKLVGMTSVRTARKFADIPSEIPGWILGGWDNIQTLLEPDAWNIYRQLMFNPQPLYDALVRYPTTLLHGDYRSGGNANLSYMANQAIPVCVFDWQFASNALMTIDLTWFINRAVVSTVVSPDTAAAYYRTRLETYLGFCFDGVYWQTMLELGHLVDALRMGCLEAYFERHAEQDDFRAYHRRVIGWYNDKIQMGARWL